MALSSTSFAGRASAERSRVSVSRSETEQWRPSPLAAEPEVANQAALHASERKRHALLQTMAEMLFVVSRTGMVLEFHAPPDSDYMLSADGLVGHSIKELLPKSIGLQGLHYVEKALRTGQLQIASYQLQMPNGVRHFEARIARYDTDQVVALVRDVTDRSFLEKELLEISNREQMRIGQDLHDGLGQQLTGITFLAKALERKLEVRAIPEAADAAEINRLILQALSQTRSLARGLFPVELEANGLEAAFRELAERVRQTCNLTCTVACDAPTPVTNRITALHLFRLTQEAVSNAARHGKARTVTIRLAPEGPHTVLAVSDDGAGFVPEARERVGMGLRIMTYRAQKIGGTLEVQSRPGGGTMVRCVFATPGCEPPASPASL